MAPEPVASSALRPRNATVTDRIAPLWYAESVFDTHAIARSLTGADLTPAQADAIRQTAEHGAHVTPEQFKTGLAELRADIYRAMLIQTGVTAGLLGLLLDFLRWHG